MNLAKRPRAFEPLRSRWPTRGDPEVRPANACPPLLLPSYSPTPLPQDKHAEEVRKNKELKEEASR